MSEALGPEAGAEADTGLVESCGELGCQCCQMHCIGLTLVNLAHHVTVQFQGCRMEEVVCRRVLGGGSLCAGVLGERSRCWNDLGPASQPHYFLT